MASTLRSPRFHIFALTDANRIRHPAAAADLPGLSPSRSSSHSAAGPNMTTSRPHDLTTSQLHEDFSGGSTLSRQAHHPDTFHPYRWRSSFKLSHTFNQALTRSLRSLAKIPCLRRHPSAPPHHRPEPRTKHIDAAPVYTKPILDEPDRTQPAYRCNLPRSHPSASVSARSPSSFWFLSPTTSIRRLHSSGRLVELFAELSLCSYSPT